ncbi:MAG: site-2 protease family protein [Thermodesulfobacteriota bacterium]|nr:site-2 protease family protein [Thermodesulfobacteriota bacterium]
MIDINKIIVMVAPLLLAVSAHEAAHGLAAYRMGDDTAARAGRITLNPIRHLDPFGSVLLPLLLAISGAPFIIGYAKPVPVNFARLTNWKKGTVVVSAAGICANLCLLAISGIAFRILFAMGRNITADSLWAFPLVELLLLLGYSVIINAILAVFNMIPIPPLDGSKIIGVFLPPQFRKLFAYIERFGIILVIFLLILKADLLFKIIMFFIAPLIGIALGGGGIDFIGRHMG